MYEDTITKRAKDVAKEFSFKKNLIISNLDLDVFNDFLHSLLQLEEIVNYTHVNYTYIEESK